MRSRLAFLLAPLLLSGAILATWSGPAGAKAAPGARSQATAPNDDPEFVYLRDCASCHGEQGIGTPRGPSLVGVGPASVDYYVATGRMPIATEDEPVRRRRPKYSPELISGLVDHVASFGSGGPDIPHVDPKEGDVARGGELFRLQCAACHAWAGNGGALLQVDAPSVLPATATQVAEAIRAGPGTMPVFGTGALNEEELADVVAYVEQLRSPDNRGGHPIWHLGPLAEGAIAWVIGMGLLYAAMRWIGE